MSTTSLRTRELKGTLLGLLVALLAPESAPKSAAAADEAELVYELRIYTAHPGKLPDLHKRFRDHTLRLFEKHGMTNVAYFTPIGEGAEDTLIYFLAHDSVDSATKSWKAFGADPEWQAAYKASHADGELVAKVERLYLAPTDFSKLRTRAAAGAKSTGKEGAVVEMRTYVTEPGRLPALLARFRDHTTTLFEKHGISNVLYGVPVDEKRRENTLVYLVGHSSRDGADQAWTAFRADPAWQKARADSEKDGKILAPMGVSVRFLKPTDYSPKK